MSWRTWFGRNDSDLRAEIQEHIEMETRENIARGMTSQEAREAAERTFGNAGVTRELVRQAKPLFWLDTLLQDIRYGARHLRRSPLLAAAIILTLAIGIGLNSSAFAVMEASMLRARVPYAHGFFTVAPQTWNKDGRVVEMSMVGYQDYVAYRDGIASLGALTAFGNVVLVPDSVYVPTIPGTLVTCNFFYVMGLEQPKLGRLLTDEDCKSQAPVALISEEIWETRFGADPKVVGSVIHMNRVALTVVGIIPAAFWGGRDDPSVFMPYTIEPLLQERDLLRESTAVWLRLAGRLNPGVARDVVQAQLAVIARQQDQLQPGRRTSMLTTDGKAVDEPNLDSSVVWAVYLMVGAPTLVLLTACANVSTLLLARAAIRRREIAVRLSLGAGRSRLMRMLITEVSLLAAIAGVLGIWISYQAPGALLKFMGRAVNYSLAPDWRVIGYLCGSAIVAGCLSALAPAIESLRVDLASSMKGEDSSSRSTGREWHARDTLVATQVALSLVLLSAAGLIARSYSKLFSEDPGFETRQVMASKSGVKTARYTAAAAESFWKNVLGKVRALPAVESACTASVVRGGNPGSISLPGDSTDLRRSASINIVSPEYFDTLGIPIVRGRTFSAAEAAQADPRVALVSLRLAQSLWPGQDAIGKLVRDDSDRQLEVIGITGNTKSGLFLGTDRQLYRVRSRGNMDDALLIRFSGSPEPVSLAVRKIIRELDPQMIPAPRTMQSLIDDSTDHLYRATKVVLLLAALPVLMSIISIYGVSAFAVAQRTKEVGIRMALGAKRGDVIWLVMLDGGKAVAWGLFCGIFLAMGSSHVLTHLFRHMGFNFTPRDPMMYFAASAVLVVTATLAMLIPARRAASADPAEVLRHE